jgi:hypothetical protein
MNEPDRPTAHASKVDADDTRSLVLRIIVVAFLAVLLWHMIVAGKP